MLILTELDPIQAAFKLSYEFKQLSMIEIEFRLQGFSSKFKCLKFFSVTLSFFWQKIRKSKTFWSEEYLELVKILNRFSCNLIALARDSAEMESLCKFYHTNRYSRMELFKKALKFRQVNFVAQSNCQQMLNRVWSVKYSGWRRETTFEVFFN